MFYKISELLVEIPSTGDMSERCKEYITENKGISADITIRADLYNFDRWSTLSNEMAIYMESGRLFYSHLLNFNGLMLHASAIEYNGKAYLFSGPSGMGKSTHTRLWQSLYGDAVQVFNDDKPALRRLDNGWFAYGTPWCGKDGINQNKKVPLGGICFLKRGEENKIRCLSNKESVTKIWSQTIRYWKDVKNLDLLMNLVDNLVREIPIFELECLPNEEAAVLSSTTMCRAAQEENL